MKQIAITTFLFLLAHIVISQQHPIILKKLNKTAEWPVDPFADLPIAGKHHTSLDGRYVNHTQLDSAKYWVWNDSIAAWSFESQTNYSYSSNSQILLNLNENLENQSLETWQFDDNGNVLEFIYQVWDGSAWLNSFRFAYLYDDDKLIEFLFQSWSGGSFENTLRYMYTYDSNGDLVEQLAENWNAGAWTNSSRRTYTYNGNHQQILVLQEHWQNGWLNQFRYTYTYGSSDELLTYLFEDWELDWAINGQTSYAYDDQLRLIEEEGQLYEGGLLVFETKTIYTYDIHGNQTSIIYQNTDSGQLANSWQEVISYDDENNEISYVYQYWDGEWVSNDSAFFYWNSVTSVSNVSTMEDDLVVFPNPASNTLYWTADQDLPYSHVNVYNTHGQLIHSLSLDLHTHQMNVSTLLPGIYIIELRAARGMARSLFFKY